MLYDVTIGKGQSGFRLGRGYLEIEPNRCSVSLDALQSRNKTAKICKWRPVSRYKPKKTSKFWGHCGRASPYKPSSAVKAWQRVLSRFAPEKMCKRFASIHHGTKFIEADLPIWIQVDVSDHLLHNGHVVFFLEGNWWKTDAILAFIYHHPGKHHKMGWFL